MRWKGRTLRDREYWGRHFWGLGTGRRGDQIYLMTSGPLSGHGVELVLSDGRKLFVGSTDPDALMAAIGDARRTALAPQ